jgi:hypothetical protein
MNKTCSLPDCDTKLYQAGFCSSHYYRNRRHGDPYAGGTSKGEALQWIIDHKNYKGDDCIQWPYYTSGAGYGRVKFRGSDKVSSRVMCMLAHGDPAKDEMDAAHECGNGHLGCMNPNHIKWKTKIDNCADKIKHGTHREGEEINFSKLKAQQVIEIFMRAKSGENQRIIANDYGVYPQTVSRIYNKKRWVHITKEL